MEIKEASQWFHLLWLDKLPVRKIGQEWILHMVIALVKEILSNLVGSWKGGFNAPYGKHTDFTAYAQ